ncbi:hypothetical protein [Acerihabitans arboris]|uniref:Uncharacterized protein n=1 Tax=Acerihabitans arboris TaxID=2691583 RepID=A0A845SHU4_9GAMM|nr:hypothetical protein [Acerihabitans arboris]NDL62952.1 hypothetical protein [Acerihabitans arboris]
MIQIEAEALQQLLLLRRKLTEPCAGLRLWLDGDACHGWRVSLEWSGVQREEEYSVEYQGLVLLAAIAHWPYLQGATLTAGARGGEQGVWIDLQATACHCDNQVCSS